MNLKIGDTVKYVGSLRIYKDKIGLIVSIEDEKNFGVRWSNEEKIVIIHCLNIQKGN